MYKTYVLQIPRQTISDENNYKNYKLNKKFRTYGVRLDVQIRFEFLVVPEVNDFLCVHFVGTYSPASPVCY